MSFSLIESLGLFIITLISFSVNFREFVNATTINDTNTVPERAESIHNNLPKFVLG
jgi:hypothetical protein